MAISRHGGTLNIPGGSGSIDGRDGILYVQTYNGINFNVGGTTYIAIASDGTVSTSGGTTFGSTITPTSDDGAALGTTALEWSDLFLASGGVINFAAGDVTVTHSTNTLTVSGGELIAAGGLTAGDGTGAPLLGVSGAAGNSRGVSLETAGSTRWTVVAGSVAESGGNAGSDFAINYHGDDGVYVDTPLTITRSTGVINLFKGLSSTTGVTAYNATAIPAGGTAGVGYKFSSTSNFGVFFGSGAPTLSAAKGSLYLRSDGSGVSDRAYINTDASATWTPITTSA